MRSFQTKFFQASSALLTNAKMTHND